MNKQRVVNPHNRISFSNGKGRTSDTGNSSDESQGIISSEITRFHLQTLWERQNCTGEEQRTFCKALSWQRVWVWEHSGRKCFRWMELFWMRVVAWMYTSFKTQNCTLRNCTLFFKSINVYSYHFVSNLHGSGAKLYQSPGFIPILFTYSLYFYWGIIDIHITLASDVQHDDSVFVYTAKWLT